MSRNTMTITKWLPVMSKSWEDVFQDCSELRAKSLKLIEEIVKFLTKMKIKKNAECTADYNFVKELEFLVTNSEQAAEDFSCQIQKLDFAAKQIMEIKLNLWKKVLWKINLKIAFCLKQLINAIASFSVLEEKLLHYILKLSVAYNKFLELANKCSDFKNLSICSNSCPYLLQPMKRMSITRLVQIIACNKAEMCAHKLIDCLLETFKSSQTHEKDEEGSDDSSLEIFRAITGHLSPPSKIPAEKSEIPFFDGSGSFDPMEELLMSEQETVISLLNAAMTSSPGLLGNDTIKKSKDGELKISAKAQKKVLEYYQEILWGEVGNFLEHIILWWGSSPLSARSPYSSQHLRDWINVFTPTANISPYVASAMNTLADALGVHVTLTLWDEKFRLALVAAKCVGNSQTGALFCDVFHELVMLCNQCEVTPEWTVGAPLEDLPLVEQIPVLHRLDHSVHTARLWVASETKKMANNWDMNSFFMIIRNDVVNWMLQLEMLRLTDYSVEIEKGRLGEHVQVCALMRAKLVSEVKENILKLKNTPAECLKCLASICRVISLANLQMIFPNNHIWQQQNNSEKQMANSYVETFLNQILTPVLSATEDADISNMILKLMCESWLDHIYTNKIKFSCQGALQLLCDFAYVTTWLTEKSSISEEMRRKMLKNEVLRRCEGVSRLLLRSPGEHIKMNDKNKKIEGSPSENAQLMPAEMYVPNQEQWLELRAKKKRLLRLSVCCGHFQ